MKQWAGILLLFSSAALADFKSIIVSHRTEILNKVLPLMQPGCSNDSLQIGVDEAIRLDRLSPFLSKLHSPELFREGTLPFTSSGHPAACSKISLGKLLTTTDYACCVQAHEKAMLTILSNDPSLPWKADPNSKLCDLDFTDGAVTGLQQCDAELCREKKIKDETCEPVDSLLNVTGGEGLGLMYLNYKSQPMISEDIVRSCKLKVEASVREETEGSYFSCYSAGFQQGFNRCMLRKLKSKHDHEKSSVTQKSSKAGSAVRRTKLVKPKVTAPEQKGAK